MPVLHVIVPIYNERETLESCLGRVLAAPLPDGWTRALLLVDDHSDAEHAPAVRALADRLATDGHRVRLHRHEVNRGKGAALQTAFDLILDGDEPGGDLVIIQDADLEYDPDDYPRLMEPIVSGRADAVLGTRWGEHRVLTRLKHRVHAWGNAVLTRLSNLMTGFRVTDMECCYKLMPVSLLRRVRPMLSEERFGIEPQIVAALARLGARVTEVPIRYTPRGPAAGKKIGWVDGVRAIWVIARERRRRGPGATLPADVPSSPGAEAPP